MKKALAAALLAALIAPAFAQPSRSDKGDDAAAAEPKVFLLDVSEATAKTGRVPNGYGKLGLTRAQKEKIYGIQAAYSERIKELEKEIEQLKAEQGVQIKDVLNDVQKTQIERYEAEAASRRASR